MILEQAIESYKFGFDITYDGDNKVILYGATCNRCGKYFYDNRINIYCNNCRNPLNIYNKLNKDINNLNIIINKYTSKELSKKYKLLANKLKED